MWLITAKEKGTHSVTIFSAGKSVGMITVEVPNSRPIRIDSDHPGPITLASAKGTTPPPLNLDALFNDADNDPMLYRIESKPDWFLIETKDGFVVDSDTADASFQLAYEVLQKVEPGSDFRVSLYANDGSGAESSRPVVLTFVVTCRSASQNASHT